MYENHCSFRVLKRFLPQHYEERYDLLYSVFSHSFIKCKDAGLEWEVQLSFPTNLDFYIDEKLNDGLNWWNINSPINDIPLQRRSWHFGQIMLQDTWTLQSWLDAVQNHQLTKVTILHFDEHADLMKPKIGLVNGNLCHLTTKQLYDPFRPNEVETAVRAGSIDQGCYIVPFLHVLDQVTIIHVVPKKTTPKAFRLVPNLAKDLSVWADIPTLSLDLVPCATENLGKRNGESYYYMVHDYNLVKKTIAETDDPIFIHIDMDYFCNRYNRQSDWKLNYHGSDDNLNSVLIKIKELVKNISDMLSSERILSIDVALVPGFFPAEYWKDSVVFLEELFKKMYSYE